MHKVSVVVPTLNRAETLAATIDRLENQTVGRSHYEILVIDNNSSDNTQSVLSQKTALYSNLRAFKQPKPGAAATRNVGIRESAGEIVLFIDDDVSAEPDLIERHIEYHRANPGSSVIGTVVAPWENSTDPFLRYLRDRGIFSPYNITSGRPMDFSYYHTGNVSTCRSLLSKVEGFSEEFFVYGMEDIELGYRLEKKGCRMIPGTAARAQHEYFPTYEQFVGRCRQAGYSLGKLLDLHPELRKRFTQSGRKTGVLRHVHGLYRIAMAAAAPIYRGVSRWEKQRGTGTVNPVLDQHYYWAIRYHFFLGYREYLRASEGRAVDPVLMPEARRIPKLAIERHD